MYANTQRNIKLTKGITESNENQPENPALFKILLKKMRGINKIIRINKIMISSGIPIPNIFLPFG
jgi:hypothetical protein